VAENILRHLLAPRHLLARLEGIAHLLQKELRRIVRQVAVRHIGIQELHSLALGAAEGIEAQILQA